MKNRYLPFILLLIIIAIPLALANGNDDHIIDEHEENENHEDLTTINSEQLKKNTLIYLAIVTVIMAIITIISISVKKPSNNVKKILFISIVIPVVCLTLYMAIATIYINSVSETKGPIHYHADFEIWNCDEKVDIVAPSGLLNRVGTSLFHDHGDNRIHIEGTVISRTKIQLHKFFEVIGGSLTSESITIPTDSGPISLNNGEKCNNEEAKLQTFLYRITNPDPKKKSGFTYEQIKLENFESYIPAPYSNIPPGDCIILEFSPEKEKTNKICETYRIAIQKGDIVENEN